MTPEQQIQDKINDLNTGVEKADNEFIYSFVVSSVDNQDFDIITLKKGNDDKWKQCFDSWVGY